ncbi:hypothetical protein EGW08_003769, partial [Elysia chlorotica]
LNALSAFWVQGYVGANTSLSRDEFEARVLEELIDTPISMQYVDYETKLEAQINLGETDTVDLCLKPNIECIVIQERKIRLESNIFEYTDSFINFGKVLTCQTVHFDSTAYRITKSLTTDALPTTKVSLQLGETSLAFSEPKDLNQMSIGQDLSLTVCKGLLDSALQSLDEERRREYYSRDFRAEVDDITQAQYYTTLVCVGASITCLFLALMTYFLFNVLRSVAGINNMFLCASLLLAQASLLASVHVSGPQTLCTVLGFLTHFLWLWVFAWSFICCFRMFKVFTAKTRQDKSDKSLTATVVRTALLSVAAPALVICSVVTASLLTSGGRRCGYGRESCYLDSPLLIGLSTALPLAIVTASNIGFFSLTVARIRSVKRLQSSDFCRKEDQRDLAIYVKLSTMTGSFWLTQIVAEAADLNFLRFVAILLNGLQGVFIFASYICNKRVLNLYLRMLGMEPMTLTSSGSQRGGSTAKISLGALASKLRKGDNPNRKALESDAGVEEIKENVFEQ